MPRLGPTVAKERAVKLVKVLNKHKGNQSAAARELGVTPQAVHDKTKQPIVQQVMQEVINKALKKANITTERVYNQLSKQLDAKKKSLVGEEDDWTAQDKAREASLELMGHRIKSDDKKDSTNIQVVTILYANKEDNTSPGVSIQRFDQPVADASTA